MEGKMVQKLVAVVQLRRRSRGGIFWSSQALADHAAGRVKSSRRSAEIVSEMWKYAHFIS